MLSEDKQVFGPGGREQPYKTEASLLRHWYMTEIMDPGETRAMKYGHYVKSLPLITVVLCGLVCSAFARESGEATVPTFADVPYDVHERTKLDFWQAEGAGPRPLLVFIHGGGWTGGDKDQLKDADDYLARGISVAAINYRYSTTDPLPAPVYDAVRAIQFLRYKADEWNIDKTRFVVTGASAGGCTALWMACHDDLANPDAADPVERESSRVQGAAVVAAQTSIDPKQIEPWIGSNVYHRMIYRAVGEKSIEAAKQNYAMHDAMYEEFSPYYHLTSDDPPLYLRYSDQLALPATNLLHGIHHGQFGIQLKKRAETVGHDNFFLVNARSTPDAEFKNQEEFIDAILLKN